MPPLKPEGSRRAAVRRAAPPGGAFVFGPFRLEPRSKRLLKEDEPIDLSPRQCALLSALVSAAGQVLPKDTLIDIVWDGVVVGDSNLEKLVSDLRKRLDERDPQRYIRTDARHGYRFVAPVTRVDAARVDVDVYALLAPDRAWADGLAALESLERDHLIRARVSLEQLVGNHPDEPRFHIGLALTCALLFDSTRADAHPDADALRRAQAEAHDACRLDPDLAECWATLGFVLERVGDRANAIAALGRAARLEKDNWLHHCRLAAATWGEDRLRAVRHTLAQNPGFAIAFLLGGMVRIARGAYDDGERDVDVGATMMSAEPDVSGRFSPVALHYVKGLLCLARGGIDEAQAAFDRELALESRGQLYARECCANTWYAKGACYMRTGDLPAARKAFGQAMSRVPGHPMARAGLAILDGSDRIDFAAGDDSSPDFDHTMARAALLVARGDVAGAVTLMHAALAAAPPGSTGWTIPVEPLLRVQDQPGLWAPVLTLLRQRAQ